MNTIYFTVSPMYTISGNLSKTYVLLAAYHIKNDIPTQIVHVPTKLSSFPGDYHTVIREELKKKDIKLSHTVVFSSL